MESLCLNPPETEIEFGNFPSTLDGENLLSIYY